MVPTHARPLARARGAARFLLPLLLALAPPAAGAATIYVPGNYVTLRAAVAAAESGDVILLSPGLHEGGAFVDGKAITIASWYFVNGDTSHIAATILDGVAPDACGGAPGCVGNAVIEFGAAAGGSRVIGLTLRNGENGVASGSAVDLTSCHVVGNGDGVDFVSGSGGTFRDCLFADNRDDGIDLNGRVNLRVQDNVIRDNGDDGVEYRLFAYSGPMLTVEITGNRFSGNGEDGIQIIDYPHVSHYTVRVERNVFEANHDASGLSAAIGCMPDGQTVETLEGAPVAERLYVINNTFVDEQNGLVGGANTIALNNLFTGIQGSAVRRVAGASITAHALFWNNGIDHEESVVDSAQLVIGDPLLDADRQLLPGSAAIGAGAVSYTWQGEVVLDLSPETSMDVGAFRFVPNQPPAVDAGPDQSVILPSVVYLAGTVTDDGKPAPGGPLGLEWSQVEGPGPAVIVAPAAAKTEVTFPMDGVYSFRLAAFDGELTGADTVQISVVTIPPLAEYRVGSPADDAEEDANGFISGNVSDLELVFNTTDQIVGMRFAGVIAPQGAAVSRAYIQFEADEVQTGAMSLVLAAQAADDAPSFTSQFRDISNRPRTSATVGWSPPPWNTVGEAGEPERTPDLSAVVQEVLNRPGWRSGNALVLIVSGTGHRTARSYEGSPSGAPLLHIELSSGVTAVERRPPPELQLHAAAGGPGRGRVRVELALPDAHPAALDLLDVAGRRIASREVGSLGPGSHTVELGEALASGVYLVRLRHGEHWRAIKVVTLR